MLSLRCLISALPQAGGGDLLLRFASSVQSCCGEGGALQADVAVFGEHSPCSARAASSFGGLSPGAARLFPPRRAARASRGLALSPWARRAFSLRGPSARCQSGLRKSLDRNRGLPWKTMGCFSGRLMSAASDQKLFCKLCSPFCCSFDEFVEEKVISPSYSSAIF